MWPVTFKTSAVITVVVAAPKKAGSKSAARYSLYAPKMTVEQYVLKVGGKSPRTALADLVWDSDRGFITIAGYKPLGASLPAKKAAE
jgi:hypothetical protein